MDTYRKQHIDAEHDDIKPRRTEIHLHIARAGLGNMESRGSSVSEVLRSALGVRISSLSSATLREICEEYGADNSGTRHALEAECMSLLDRLASGTPGTDGSEFEEFKHRILRSPPPWLDFPQSHTGLQQFSGITALDSSRFHAGNSYVGRLSNYYAPKTPTPKQRVQEPPALLAALEFPQMNFRRMNIEKEFPGTCKWLESTEEYKRWREPQSDDSHYMLWIKGIPGAGKSTIMKHAYSEEKAASSYMTIAFFFNAKGRDLAKSAEGMFRTLLYQLVSGATRDLSLSDMVTRSDMEYFKEHGWPLASLKDLFRQAVMYRAKEHLKPVVSYIDALDECAETKYANYLRTSRTLPKR